MVVGTVVVVVVTEGTVVVVDDVEVVVGGVQSGSATTLHVTVWPAVGAVGIGHQVPSGAVGCGSVCAEADAIQMQAAHVASAARTASVRRRRLTSTPSGQRSG